MELTIIIVIIVIGAVVAIVAVAAVSDRIAVAAPLSLVVAGTTLLAQGLTLPRVIRVLKISGDDVVADRAEYGELVTVVSGSAQAVLDDPASPGF